LTADRRRVSASIVLYHGDLPWAVRAVASLAAQQPPCGPIKVLCNDDDGTEAAELTRLLALANLSRLCTVTSSAENLGYSGGHNRALAEEFAAGAEAVLVVNADLTLRPNAVERLALLADRFAGRVLVGPVLSLADADGEDEGLLDTTGIVWSRSGRHFDGQQGEPLAEAPDAARPVAGISGACLYVPRAAYDHIVAQSGEFFDELFFAYREDAELGFRAGLLGVPSWVEPAARGLHARGTRGTSRAGSAAVNRLGVQNRFLTAFKYGRSRPGGSVLPWLRDLLVVAAVVVHERSSLPGLWRALSVRHEVRAKGRQVLDTDRLTKAAALLRKPSSPAFPTQPGVSRNLCRAQAGRGSRADGDVAADATGQQPNGSPFAPASLGRRRDVQLDGLRAVAVLLVFLHHLDIAAVPGGFLGVDLFFALSGYLITSLLVAEFARTDRISFSSFYARRALRLAPALFAMTVPVMVWAQVFGIGAPIKDGCAGLLYLMDFYAPATHGGGGVFGHTWSLAVEEQFYLVWPVLLVCGLRERWHLSRLVAAVGAGFTVAAALCRLVLHLGPAELYWSPLPHVVELAAGALLAFALATHPERVRACCRHSSLPYAALAAIVLGCFHLDEGYTLLYVGGFAVIGLICAAVIGHLLVEPTGAASRALSVRPLIWLGARSYGFYLWHYPILIAFSRRLSSHLEVGLLALPTTLLVTQLSWRYLESPFLRLKDRRYQPTGAASPTAVMPIAPARGGFQRHDSVATVASRGPHYDHSL
jgi:peptidoglycan/LPS O-acetylase OafA/YrhL/GT2 family glycosyltransferase